MQRITNMKPPAGTCNCPDGRFFPLFAAKKFFEKRKNPKFPCNTDEHAPAPEADRAKRIDRIPKTNIAAIAVLIHRMLFSFSDKAGQHAEYCPIRYVFQRIRIISADQIAILFYVNYTVQNIAFSAPV